MAADAVGAAPVWARDDVARIARPARVAKAHAALALAVPTAVAGAGVLAAVGAAPAWLAHARAFDARAVRCGQRRSVAAAVAPVDVAEADVDHAVGWLEAGSATAHTFVAVGVAGAAHVVAGVALASRLLHDRRRRRGPRWRRQREGVERQHAAPVGPRRARSCVQNRGRLGGNTATVSDHSSRFKTQAEPVDPINMCKSRVFERGSSPPS